MLGGAEKAGEPADVGLHGAVLASGDLPGERPLRVAAAAAATAVLRVAVAVQGARVLRREVVADGEAERGDLAGGVEPPPAPRERGLGHRSAGVADAGEDGDEDLVGEGAEQVGVVARAGPVAAAGQLRVGIVVVVAGLHRAIARRSDPPSRSTIARLRGCKAGKAV